MGIKDWFKKDPVNEVPTKKNPEGHMSYEVFTRRNCQLHSQEYTRGWKASEVADARRELARRYFNQPEVKAQREEELRKRNEYNRIYLEQQKRITERMTAEELKKHEAQRLEEAKQFAKKKKTK